MTGRRHLQTQYDSSNFVISAGALPFQFDAAGRPRRIVLVHYGKRDEWLLAKGRKDQGESISSAATREVLEETGFPCRLHTIPHLPTYAPLPSSPALGYQPQMARIAHGSTEPFSITIRPLDTRNVKLIFWYIGAIDIPYDQDSSLAGHAPGSHQVAEGFDEAKLVDIDDALERLTYEGDRDLVRTAVRVLTSDSLPSMCSHCNS